MEERPIGRRINDVSRLFGETVKNKAGRNGMNQTTFFTLTFLNHEYRHHKRKEITQKDIASFVHVKAPTMSVALQSLEQDGYIVRTKSAHDSRKIIVSLTNQGIDLLEDMKKYFLETDELIEKLFQDEEYRQFISYLERIEDALRNEGKNA